MLSVSYKLGMLNRCLEFLAGVESDNTREVIGTSSPVLGLRLGRDGLSRKSKLPKPESFTPFPPSSVMFISSKNASTMPLASRLLSPTLSNNKQANSAFVKVIADFNPFNLHLGLLDQLFHKGGLAFRDAGYFLRPHGIYQAHKVIQR